MTNKRTLITIITPTYNREECLKKCWDSLCQQSFTRFQWLIIDDGSNDKTEEVVKGFIENSKFQIEYHKKKNGGKHTALNYSHPYIKGKYVAILSGLPNQIGNILRKYLRLVSMNLKICGRFFSS